MKNEAVKRFPNNKEQAKREAANALVEMLKEPFEQGRQILLLMSGGSWVEVMNMIDDGVIDLANLAQHLTLTTLDERVTIGQDNNYRKIVEASDFVKKLINHGARVIETVPQNDEVEAEEFGSSINTALEKWFNDNPSGVAVATVGVGGLKNVEGHIAGIEPMDDSSGFESLFETTSLYVGYTARQLTPPKRATATFVLLSRLSSMVVLILGKEEKSESLRKSLDDSIPLSKAPCSIISRHSHAVVITDIPQS